MTYALNMTVQWHDPREPKEVVRDICHALWPYDQDGVCVPDGHSDGEFSHKEGMHSLTLILYRDLGNDMEVIQENPTVQHMTLEEALCWQFFSELSAVDKESDQIGRRLLFGAKVFINEITINKNAPSAIVDANTKNVFDETIQLWHENRARRVKRLDEAARRQQEDDDLRAYARVCARRGLSADREWPTEVIDEYVKAANRVLVERFLPVIQDHFVNGADAASLRTIEEAAAYLKAVVHL